MVRCCAAAALLPLLFAGRPVTALRVQEARLEQAERASLNAAVKQHGRAILARFAAVDRSGDGTVTFQEMRAGFGHHDGTPERRGERLLRGMLAACAGVEEATEGEAQQAPNCSRAQMEATVAAWSTSRRSVTSLLSLSHDPKGGFKELDHPQMGKPCGAGLRTTLPKVRCIWERPACWDINDPVAAWSLASVCSSHGCVCDPSDATKRMAKLGVAGAMAIAGTFNMSDESDWRSTPACGSGWEGTWKGPTLKGLTRMVELSEVKTLQSYAQAFAKTSGDEANILNADKATVDFAVFKSAGHQLTKGGPLEPVCMISWQSTHKASDFKLNFLAEEVNFPWVRDQGAVKLPHGLVEAYRSARFHARSIFERECCTKYFRAKRLVISGHSHGGAMAEMNAVDAISFWTCGRKLTADDISVVLIAPHNRFMSMEAVTNIWSCADKIRCLAGSTVTLVNSDDYAGGTAPFLDSMGSAKALLHPSRVTQLPCDGPPKAAHQKHWCHDLGVYARNVEDILVDQQEWGSSCNGVCGDPNRQLQCGAWHSVAKKSCLAALPSELGRASPCDSATAWRPEQEKCECQLDQCDTLLASGCA